MERVGIYFSLGGFFVRKDGKRFSLYLIAALILVSIASFMMLRSEAEPYAAARPDVIYVSESGGADGKDGTSWNNAYAADNLQTAVNASAASSDQGVMVWVMRGNYARTGTLTLTKGAKVYGGFNGNETDIASRDVAAMMKNPLSSADAAILSSDGSKISIVTGGSGATSADTVFDGFTITGGKGTTARVPTSELCGGGMYNTESSPTVANCTFSGNTAEYGGGMCNYNSTSPTVTNCIFSNNTAKYGGGMLNMSSSPTVQNCTFYKNGIANDGTVYTNFGGGIMNMRKYPESSSKSSDPLIINCRFTGNKVNASGGGMNNKASSPTVIGCVFNGNASLTSNGYGGAIENDNGCSVTIINSTICENMADNEGGGVLNRNNGDNKITLINSTIYGNTVTSASGQGGGLYDQNNKSLIVNSIIWGNSVNGQQDNIAFTPTARYCVIESGTVSDSSVGVISADPKLVSVDLDMNRAKSAEDIYMYIISGDSKEDAETSSAIGEGIAVGQSVASGALIPSTDQSGRIRTADYVDIGAYQYVQSGDARLLNLSIDKTEESLQAGNSVVSFDITDMRPVNFSKLSVKSTENTSAVLNGKTVTLTAKRRAGIDSIPVILTYQNPAGTGPEHEKTIAFKLTATPYPNPADPLPAENRTDGDGSGVLIVSPDTYESLKVFDAFKVLSADDKLPSGITITSLDAVPAASTDLSIDCYIEGPGGKTSGDIIAGAIKDYWGITDTSPEKLRLVSAVSATATAGSNETALAKFWRILVEKVRELLRYAPDTSTDSAYLPLQTNFTITSADIALLSDDIKTELNAGNLLDKVNLFAVVKIKSGDQYQYAARSLNDAADKSGASRGKYITVSEDLNGNYRISTRIMLFNLPGTVSGDKTTGASWILPISSDKTSDDYFIVQDGNKDEEYAVAMALAAKTSNYATIRITAETTSGDTPVSYDTIISGDLGFREKTASSDWSNAEMSGDVYTVTFAKVAGYSISLNGGSEAYTVSKDLEWGASWDVKATYSKIYVSGVSLDKTALVLAPGGSDKLTATVTPGDAYAKNVTWTTSDKNIAEIAVDGTVTAKTAGRATITATANDGGGAPAACAVTVRNNAGDDPTAPSLTPELIVHAIARPSEIELADNTASYVTDAAKQTTVATAAGFLDEDTALTETGALAAGSTVVNGAVNDVIAKDPAISKDIVYALPIVESKAAKAGMLHAISFKVSGDIFGEVTGAEIRVLKVFPDGTGELFTPISAPEEIADKTAAPYDTNEAMVTGAIDKEADYILTVFVKDGESFDLDGKADGTVIDPVSIIKAAAVEPDQPDNTRSHNGGCNTGAAGIAMLFLLVPAAIINKKRK